MARLDPYVALSVASALAHSQLSEHLRSGIALLRAAGVRNFAPEPAKPQAGT